MERVKKGEGYWILLMDKFGIYPLGHNDYRHQSDDLVFEQGNYYRTKEQAEAMANKLRAVLKGADVIEMPSEEEYEKIIPQRIGCSDEFAAGEGNGYWHGYNYLKSKIIK